MAYVRQLGSYTWRIKEWSSKAYEDVLNSRVFAVGDTRWCAARRGAALRCKSRALQVFVTC